MGVCWCGVRPWEDRVRGLQVREREAPDRTGSGGYRQVREQGAPDRTGSGSVVYV